MHSFLRLLILIALLLPALPCYAQGIRVEEATLENGLRVIVIPDHKVPVVTHMLWYKVGASEDPTGKSGLAHFLEHLMFKGTKKYPPGQFQALVAKNGGRENAFTTHDYTAYYQTIAVENLSLVMSLEADRMKGVQLTPEAVFKERDVIVEERRFRVENVPLSLLEEQMRAALFLNYPYGRPAIGWKHEMENLMPEDALAFYHQYYSPSNAILVVVGDIELSTLLPLAKKYYGAISKESIPPRLQLMEPPAIAARRVLREDEKAASPELARYYLAPVIHQDHISDSFALELLEQIIGGGDTSRLYRALVEEKKLAVGVQSNYDILKLGPSVFSIYVIPSGKETTALEAALNQQIALLLENGVTAEELTRAKKVLKAEAIYARDGVENMARWAGKVAVVGASLDSVRNWDSLVDAVTVEQVNRMARTVLQPERSVTGILMPVKK